MERKNASHLTQLLTACIHLWISLSVKSMGLIACFKSQTISCQPVNEEARVQSQDSPCANCGGYCGTGKAFLWTLVCASAMPVPLSLNLCSILILPSPILSIQPHSTVYDCFILTSCQHSYQDGYWQQHKSTAPTDAASPWLWLPLVLGDVQLLAPADTTAAVDIKFTVR
jgi:hypothetical protein